MDPLEHHQHPAASHHGNATKESLLPNTWRCMVCNVPHNILVNLPCKHQFCDRCFDLWIGIYIDNYRGNRGHFPCQICWHLFEVPEHGLRAYKVDYRVKLLEDELNQLGMTARETNSNDAMATNAMTTDVDSSHGRGDGVGTEVDMTCSSSNSAARHSAFGAGYCYRSDPIYGHLM